LALLLPDLGGGGAERVFVNLAAGFADAGLEVDLVLFRALGPYLDSVPATVRLVDLASGRALRSLVPLVRYLRRRRPDALLSGLHTANLVAVAAVALAGTGTRLVLTVHNDLEREFGSAPTARSRSVLWLLRRLYPRADRVVAVSNGVRDALAAAGVTASRLETIYNPVVTDEMFDSAREDPPHPWLADGGAPVLVTLGRLEAQKDHLTLLDAFAQLRRRQEARLLILGEGGERRRLEARVSELGLATSVALPGFVDNPYAALARADMFVLSSRWEGLPTVLIEALALGCRIVATDCPWGPREILADGRYGTLVPVGDPGALAEALASGLALAPFFNDTATTEIYTLGPAVDAYLTALGVSGGA
jgi:glycosyltransferase involved in cell wall biosynthesis